jgi:tetratricopeptide (TPR) repeat protein
MSLLMKALEKAAKDRGGDTRPAAATAAVSAAAPAGPGLALEPIAVEVSTAPRQEAAPGPAPAATARPARAAAPARNQAQALAGEVLQAQSAGRPAAGGAGAYARAHPIMVFGTLAGLTALGFGIYVYLQIFQPGLFAARPPAPKGLVPLSQAPVPPPVPGTIPQSAAPLAAAPLLKEAADESAAATARAKPQPAAPLAAAPEEGRRNVISVSRGSPEPVLNPLHAQAYSALQAGQLDEARRLYGQLANAEPKNVDALLGLAAIAAQRGNVEEASRLYLQILELEPRHALAQSGLIALLGSADPLAAESRLRQLIAREPSAYLHFTLGNLYADQSQWAAAQQAYFQAHHLEPVNPDYAYNLAVALEHVSQPKLALGFYRRAVQLAATRGRTNFNLAQAQERVAILARQVE